MKPYDDTQVAGDFGDSADMALAQLVLEIDAIKSKAKGIKSRDDAKARLTPREMRLMESYLNAMRAILRAETGG